MGYGGSTTAMIVSLRNNAILRDRHNLFAQLRSITNKQDAYSGTSVSKTDLKKLRQEKRAEIKWDRKVRIVIGLVILIPFMIGLVGLGILITGILIG